MSLIEVEDLRKTFNIAVRKRGRFGALRTLLAREYREVHAVEGVSFYQFALPLDRSEAPKPYEAADPAAAAAAAAATQPAKVEKE